MVFDSLGSSITPRFKKQKPEDKTCSCSMPPTELNGSLVGFRQSAVFLGIPTEVVEQAPSLDMMRSITDEFALVITDHKIDLVVNRAIECQTGCCEDAAPGLRGDII